MTILENQSPADHRAAAERWLAKAVTMEAEGKPKGLVDKALAKACEYEDAANGKLPKAA